MKQEVIALGIVACDDQYLIAQRKDSGKWEFVSCNVASAEIAEKTLLSQLALEFGLSGNIVATNQPYRVIDNNTQWTIVPYIVQVMTNQFTLFSDKHSDLKWVSKEELQEYGNLFVVNTERKQKQTIFG